MINLNREAVFVNMYLLEKEFYLPNRVRNALSMIYRYMKKNKLNKAIAIHNVNNYYKSKFDIDFTKKFLHREYNKRLAHIKNGKEKYKKWAKEMRENANPLKPQKLCACGCGLPVKPRNKYINGHNARCRNKEVNNELAARMREKKEVKKKENNNIIFLDQKIENPKNRKKIIKK
ncbi:MAG: hypothetical protein ACTSPQ_12740 [Candidatus Helarchaeota archaeon]